MSTSGNSPKRPPADPPKDYEIGYGRPPVHTRFKAGNPGNPRGRRKKKTVGKLIDETMNKRIKIEERGRSRTMTVQELILFSMGRAAMKGDLAAARTLFALKERYQDTDETVLDPSDLEADDRKIIEEHLAKLGSPNPKSEGQRETETPNDSGNNQAPDDADGETP
jgi:Family of unknown function (DUF5681)